ncbi:acyl-CoA dehydrogenase family protein [Pseudoduganella violaceinigra]|uniref:acyl-CoA dehydrogenase family protein n=1 Tax=Pseudoduganella violaceinigra TaxID=246602 RepID=UPI0003FAAE80|nr:acyl-CoA dehydrogenase family protein [Pseudoduganella violaceinigra]
MMLQWTQEQLALRERYAALGAQLAARTGQPEGFDRDGWRQLGDAGLWRLIVPANFGGAGTDWWAFTAALEGLASSIRTPELLLSVIAQAGLVRALVHYGSPAQQDKYFAAILRGDLSSTGIAEPGTGTDVRSIETRLTPEGDNYVLNGGKYNIAHAPVVDFMMIVSRANDEGAISLVLLDKDAPGLRIGKADDKLGNRNLPTGALHFDNVPVAASQILGKPGKGLQQLIDIISLGRLYYGLVASHLVTPFLADAMAYAKQRISFKDTIAEHQYVQRRLTDLKIGAERGRWLAYGALTQLMAGDREALLTCSAAKLVGAEDLINGAISLVKLYGSLGYHNNDISTLARNALGFASVGGTEEMHRKNIYNQLVRLSK